MDKGLFNDDFTSVKSPATKIDDFTRNLKENTMDFLSHERSDEKIDAEKPKPDVDDFLNFHDDIGDSKPMQAIPSPIIPKVEKDDEIMSAQPEQEIDFDALDDEHLNPNDSSGLKGFTENQKEQFISSEDLLTDFKDPVQHDEPVKEEPVKAPSSVPAQVNVPEPTPASALAMFSEPESAPVPVPAKVELPKVVAPVEKPPVVEPVKPAEEPPKPKAAPPPAPAVKQSTTDDTQIEAEKLFKSIGLG